jgi:TIR domain
LISVADGSWQKMSGQIFISYRREDSAASAGRVYDRLSGRFRSSRIFIDVDNIAPGIDFVAALEKSVGSCDVLISVVGARWLTATDEDGKRRLDDPEDFVRLEIATALKRGIRVIPVLVDGASMPRSSDLPDDLKSLVRLQALKVSQDRFRSDSEPLITAVDQALEEARAERRKRSLTSLGKRTWLSVAGVLTVLALVVVAAILYFSYHPSKPTTPDVLKPPSVTPAPPLVVVTPSQASVTTPSVEEKAPPTPEVTVQPSAKPTTPVAAVTEPGNTTADKRTGGIAFGTFEFNWPGGDVWDIYQGEQLVATHSGDATQALQAGTYTIKPRSNPVFKPFEVSIKSGTTTKIDMGGIFEFNWPGGDVWDIYQGKQLVATHSGDNTQALQAGTYTIKPRSNPVFKPFEVQIRDGGKTIVP